MASELRAGLDEVFARTGRAFAGADLSDVASVGDALRQQQARSWSRILGGDAGTVGSAPAEEGDARTELSPDLLVGAYGVMLERMVHAALTASQPRLSFGGSGSRSAAALDGVTALIRSAFAEMNGALAAHVQTTQGQRDRFEQERRDAEAEQKTALGSAATGLSRLAEGDLTVRLEGLPERYTALETDFNGAVAELQRLLRTVTSGTQGMAGGIDVISESASDLSERTREQARSIKSTADTLGELTATVARTAESAEHVRAFVANAKADAEKSGAVVRDAVAAMSEIERSSEKIGEISNVIDEIAFQTNLLALNAGIEAARAGEAGRGFAVVAYEVRALAGRSAEAARDISELIEASRRQVGAGVSFVGEAREALGRIASQVTDINGIIAEIARSAQEQANGLAEVNGAMSQMDGVTRQNATMAQDATAIIHCLQAEAGELAHLLGQIKVGELRMDGEARRKDERFQRSEPVWVTTEGRRRQYTMLDCSFGGARFEGEAPASAGVAVSIELGGKELSARMVRANGTGFAIQFADSEARGVVSRFLLLNRKKVA